MPSTTFSPSGWYSPVAKRCHEQVRGLLVDRDEPDVAVAGADRDAAVGQEVEPGAEEEGVEAVLVGDGERVHRERPGLVAADELRDDRLAPARGPPLVRAGRVFNRKVTYALPVEERENVAVSFPPGTAIGLPAHQSAMVTEPPVSVRASRFVTSFSPSGVGRSRDES